MSLILGTAQFGMDYGVSNTSGQVSFDDVKDILLFANSVGITTLDTAHSYGQSESTLGLLNSDTFKIITKLPKYPGNSVPVKQWVFNAINQSQYKLKKYPLDAVLVHHSEDLLSSPGNSLISALLQAKESNLVKQIGISIYEPHELIDYQYLDCLDIVQAPMNAVDSRVITSDLLGQLDTHSCQLHLRSCFLQGLLIMNPTNIPSRLSKYRPLLESWHIWCSDNKITPLQACLNYVKQRAPQSDIVVGCLSKPSLRVLFLHIMLNLFLSPTVSTLMIKP